MKLKDWLKSYFDEQNNEDLATPDTTDDSVATDTMTMDAETPEAKKGFFSQVKDKTKSVFSSASEKAKGFISREEEKAKIKLEKARKIKRIVFIVWNILSIVFYTLISLISIIKSWNDSPLSLIIIGITVVYVLVFVVILLVSAKSEKLNQNIAKYKSGMRLWRILLGLLNTAIALMVVINTLSADGFTSDIAQTFATALSIAWLSIKVLSSIIKLIKFARKQKKLTAKQKLA